MFETMLQAATESLAGENVEALDREELEAELVGLRAAIDRLEAEAGRRLAAFVERRGYTTDGYPSATSFLKHRCRMAGGRAHRLVGLAIALQGMPLAAKLYLQGELSTDQVQALATAWEAHPDQYGDGESDLVEAARISPFVEQLRTTVAYWRQAIDGEAFRNDHNRMREERRLYCSRTFQGMFRIDGWLDPEAGELLLAALRATTPPPTPSDRRTTGQRRADALTDLACYYLNTTGGRRNGVERPHLDVLVSFEALTDQGQGTCETANGQVLDHHAVSRLACDASIRRIVMDAKSQPLDVGTKTRVVPAALRKAAIARDRHCQFHGCDRPYWFTDVHHIVHVAEGGATKLDNLILLCRHHHTLVHDGGWTLTGTPGQLTITRPDGTTLGAPP